MSKKRIRDLFRLVFSLLFSIIYLPHLVIVLFMDKDRRQVIFSDIKRLNRREILQLNEWSGLLFHLHTNSYYRSLFYFRIGPVWSYLIGWYRPGNKYFIISYTTKIGRSFLLAHPYATIINAESIGDDFSCIQCTTLGDSKGYRPIIGNNVSLGANVTIIGNVKIGNNVSIGAGSVVVKDIPDNCTAVGNPCRPIKFYN